MKAKTEKLKAEKMAAAKKAKAEADAVLAAEKAADLGKTVEEVKKVEVEAT
jgi:hypothetical protein